MPTSNSDIEPAQHSPNDARDAIFHSPSGALNYDRFGRFRMTSGVCFDEVDQPRIC
jgi:hypothetical protein